MFFSSSVATIHAFHVGDPPSFALTRHHDGHPFPYPRQAIPSSASLYSTIPVTKATDVPRVVLLSLLLVSFRRVAQIFPSSRKSDRFALLDHASRLPPTYIELRYRAITVAYAYYANAGSGRDLFLSGLPASSIFFLGLCEISTRIRARGRVIKMRAGVIRDPPISASSLERSQKRIAG